MFPIGDDNRDRRAVPVITYALIALNVAVFFLEMNGGEAFIQRWAFVPSRFLSSPETQFLTLFTSMFMHAGLLHLGSNMLYLWIFGDNVEDHFGQSKYLVFYLLSGLGATGAQLIFSADSGIPHLGASGAIAGILGAYLVLFPNRRVLVLGRGGVVPVPALLMIGLWFVLQLFSSVGSITSAVDTGGVAFMAHVGGFVSGVILTYVLAGRPRARLTG